MQLNREQRRAAHKTHAVLVRKTKRQRHHVDPRAGLRALDRARPFDPCDTVAQHILLREAMERLVDGTGNHDDFDLVAMALNLARVRAADIDAKLDAVFAKSEAALVAVRERHQRLGKFGFSVLELEATNEALDAQEPIVNASSPQQIHDALMTVCKRLNVQIDSRVKRGML